MMLNINKLVDEKYQKEISEIFDKVTNSAQQKANQERLIKSAIIMFEKFETELMAKNYSFVMHVADRKDIFGPFGSGELAMYESLNIRLDIAIFFEMIIKLAVKNLVKEIIIGIPEENSDNTVRVEIKN